MSVRLGDSYGVPASELEISSVEEWFGLRLPDLYRGFLAKYGNGEAPLDPSVFSYKVCDLSEIRQVAYATVREAQSSYQWRDEDFVFACDYDGNFLMFRSGGEPDPEVLTYLEGSASPTPLNLRFSEWLDEAVTDYRG